MSDFPSRRPTIPSPDVAIVGGGIIGLALARDLARAGARVSVLERGELGREASAAAAGMLGPQAESDGASAAVTLGVASRRLHVAVAAALREETGLDVEHQDDGIVYVARSVEDDEILARRRAWQVAAGLRAEALDADDVRRVLPGIAADIHGGVLFPDDHRVDNVRLTTAYALACARLGVELRAGTPVTALRRAGDAAVGVDTAGAHVPAGVVVNAAGAWAGWLAPGLPVRPVRGQMVLLGAPAALAPCAVYSRAIYLVPRRDGRLLAGSTYEEAGFDARVTAGAVAEIVARALALVPALATASFRGAWAGLRPGTPDNLPILGADPEVRGLVHATGHYRSGILLAPITARCLTALILEGRAPEDLTPFAPGRF